MEVPLRKLTDEEIDALTYLLARRPNYGIAIPSQKWLSRQQEKVARLPEILLEPKNRLLRQVKRLSFTARKVLGELDLARPLPERAVLCSAHERLNPFLLREIFWLLCLEIGEHLECLRRWPHKSSGMASWLTRLDSITAYFMSKHHFHRMFGCAPHDSRFVQVVSKCEACILAAVGANGRCLADLYAALTLRQDANCAVNSRRKYKPRLLPFVDSWISQMRSQEERTVRQWGDELLQELRPGHLEIRSYWREYQKTEKRKRRGCRKREGSTARGKRPLRHSTSAPRIKVDRTTASEQRRLYQGPDVAQSIYRDDSLANEANVTATGPGGIPVGLAASSYDSGSSSGEEEERGFGQPMPFPGSEDEDNDPNRYPQIGSTYDDSYEKEDEVANDLEQDPEDRDAGYSADSSHRKVSEWYNKCLQDTSGSELDPEDIHPAIRREKKTVTKSQAAKSYFSVKSAVPAPLRKTKIPEDKIVEEEYTPARTTWTKGSGAEKPLPPPPPPPKSEWTDFTVHTELPSGVAAGADAPPLPLVPLRFGQQKASSSVYVDTTTAGTSTAASSTLNSPTPTAGSGPDEYEPMSPYTSNADASSMKSGRPPLFDRRELQYPESEVTVGGSDRKDSQKGDSKNGAVNKRYLEQNRGALKSVDPGMNPFIRQGSTRKRDGSYQQGSPMPRKGTPLSESNLHERLDCDERMKLRRDLSLSRRTDASLLADDSASCVAPRSQAAGKSGKSDITSWTQVMKKG